MSFLQALLLGLVQGFTEFLPVSSSAHLALTEHLLGFKNLDQLVFFGLVCHLGTLGAIFTVFKNDIFAAFKNKSQFLAVLIGTLPLFPLALLLKPLKSMFDRLDILGFFFILTALLIWLGTLAATKTKVRILSSASSNSPQIIRKPKPYDPLIIGCFQALAILPGVSRSGSTISGAQILGWEPTQAIRFSFLLAIPAILGGFTLELLHVIKDAPPFGDLIPLFTGLIVSYFSGLVALKILIHYTMKKNLLPFAWYCLILGIMTLLVFNYG